MHILGQYLLEDWHFDYRIANTNFMNLIWRESLGRFLRNIATCVIT